MFGRGVVRASMKPRGERVDGVGNGGIERSDGGGVGYTRSTMEVTTFTQNFGDATADFPVWEKIGAIVRLSYGIGIISILISPILGNLVFLFGVYMNRNKIRFIFR